MCGDRGQMTLVGPEAVSEAESSGLSGCDGGDGGQVGFGTAFSLWTADAADCRGVWHKDGLPCARAFEGLRQRSKRSPMDGGWGVWDVPVSSQVTLKLLLWGLLFRGSHFKWWLGQPLRGH